MNKLTLTTRQFTSNADNQCFDPVPLLMVIVKGISVLLLLSACARPTYYEAWPFPMQPAVESSVSEMTPENVQLNVDSEPAATCVEMGVGSAPDCATLEANILASTVRLVIVSQLPITLDGAETYSQADGYATVKGGRYLVTHNHFGLPLSVYDDEQIKRWLVFILFRSDGSYLLQSRATDVSLVAVGQETLIFDFGEVEGMGLLAQFGLPSAEFGIIDQRLLTAATVVGQIDWDGERAHVNWTTIRSVETVEGAEAMRVSSCIKLGASGGGVFWNGMHVGNNWSRPQACVMQSTSLVLLHSTVALNGHEITR